MINIRAINIRAIDVKAKHLKELFKIFKEYLTDAEVWVFGSRYKGTAKNYSDIDLVIVRKEKLPLDQLFKLKDAFEESDLPFRVDILDWHSVSEEMQNSIKVSGYEVIWRSASLS